MATDIKQIETLYTTLRLMVIQYGIQFAVAIGLLLVGLWLGKRLARFVEGLLVAKHVDLTLSKFLSNLVQGAVAVLVAVLVLNQMGFAIAPLVAAIGALAFGASFAIQGLLSNYGSGLAIIITRPYLVGDTIETQGQAGVVKEIKLGQTLLESEDGELISIPNHMILGKVLVNSGPVRLADQKLGVAYGTDVAQVRELLLQVLRAHPLVIQEPAPKAGLDELGESSLDMRVRYWVPTLQYYTARFEVMQELHAALVKAGVEIPYPQRVVHSAKN